jgi:2'-5' RNA ligase
MRCFLALFPDAASRERLLAIAARLPGALRRVPEEDLHLTLVFLGEVSLSRVDVLRDALAGVSFAGVSGHGIGWRWLPEVRRARVGAVEIASDGAVEALASTVRARLALGPGRRFLPHVSLVRVRGAVRPLRPDCATGVLCFDRLGLYASEPRPQGPGYRPLSELHG